MTASVVDSNCIRKLNGLGIEVCVVGIGLAVECSPLEDDEGVDHPYRKDSVESLHGFDHGTRNMPCDHVLFGA